MSWQKERCYWWQLGRVAEKYIYDIPRQGFHEYQERYISLSPVNIFSRPKLVGNITKPKSCHSHPSDVPLYSEVSMAGVNIMHNIQGEVFSYWPHLISPIVGLTTTVPKFILEKIIMIEAWVKLKPSNLLKTNFTWVTIFKILQFFMYSRRPPKVCPVSQQYFNCKYDNEDVGGTKWKLFKSITSYIVLQDDVVMIDRVVDEVDLGR